MERLKVMWRRLLIWLGVISKPDFLALLVTDHPLHDSIRPGYVYIVGGNGYQKWAYLRCPSSTSNEVIQLSLMPNHRPRWQVKIDRLGRPSIYPSIRLTDDSYAHFWLKKGMIKWCADSGNLHKQG